MYKLKNFTISYNYPDEMAPNGTWIIDFTLDGIGCYNERRVVHASSVYSIGSGYLGSSLANFAALLWDFRSSKCDLEVLRDETPNEKIPRLTLVAPKTETAPKRMAIMTLAK